MFLSATFLALLLVYSNGLLYRSLIEEQWQEFKLKHQKIYTTEGEEQFRMNVFMKNLDTILEHNQRYELGASTYKMGMNKFGDLTDDEFQRYYAMPRRSSSNEDYDDLPEQNSAKYEFPAYLYSDKPLPKEMDWRTVRAVTEVKNQEDCGSCYAFIATGALEAQYFFKTKKLVSLSEQNIIDCTYKAENYSNNGCLGGKVDFSFQYIIENGGINTEKFYPYIADRDDCAFDKHYVGAKMSSYVQLPKGNETALQMAVAWIGPIAVMVDNNNSMRFYAGGIYDEPSCSNTEYNHGLLAVGYGKYKKWEYWLLKNSYGAEWGEMGYIMMMRNKNNQCAIATAALYPVV